MTPAPKHQRHTNGVETLASAPDTEASTTYDRIPLLQLATRTAARDTMKQHPGTSCLFIQAEAQNPDTQLQNAGVPANTEVSTT